MGGRRTAYIRFGSEFDSLTVNMPMYYWWAQALLDLCEGKNATVSPRGGSMAPKIFSGDEVVLEPIRNEDRLEKGDIVLVKVKGRVYLHLIKALDEHRVQIGNNRGGINGWTSRSLVYGRAIKVAGVDL